MKKIMSMTLARRVAARGGGAGVEVERRHAVAVDQPAFSS